MGSDCLGQGPHPNPSPTVQHLQERPGREHQGTRRGSGSLGGHWRRSHRERKEGRAKTVTKGPTPWKTLSQREHQDHEWSPCGLEEAQPGQESSRTCSWQPLHGWLGIQVKQESRRGAWRIPSIDSVLFLLLVSSLSTSSSLQRALTVTKEQKDWHRAVDQMEFDPWPLFAPCSKNKISDCPAWTSAFGKAGAWQRFPCRKSHISAGPATLGSQDFPPEARGRAPIPLLHAELPILDCGKLAERRQRWSENNRRT